MATSLWAAPAAPEAAANRNFDARIEHNHNFQATPRVNTSKSLGDLSYVVERTTGGLRSLSNPTGYLSPATAHKSASPERALEFVGANLDILGLSQEDLAGIEVSDVVYSQVSGSTHVYFRQRHRDLPVYNAVINVQVNREGRILGLNSTFLPDIAVAAQRKAARPGIDAAMAASQAAEHLGISAFSVPKRVLASATAERKTTFIAEGLSSQAIEARLMWLPIRAGDARLVWNFQIHSTDDQHLYDLTVDAESGAVWTRFDWVSPAQYRVYTQPTESPNHTTPVPPADGRLLAFDPADPVASPSGWHDAGVTIMDGNNVHAYEDRDLNNFPPASEPSCGATLNCDFPLNLSAAPSASIPAAMANLFYWNNTLHDVQYKYGFDEAAGNFQESNFGRGGFGSDSVNAEGQDGSGNCDSLPLSSGKLGAAITGRGIQALR
jgi:extracellular elastinolytic metalloproteinase